MKFSVVLTSIVAGASLASATPAIMRRDSSVCSGLESNAQCCSVDVLGIADLNCADPPSTPTSVQDFIDICAAIGQEAECCALPVAGQALICESPS